MQETDMVRMANQMADFFKSYGEQEAVDGIADHINKFWDPRMRRDFFAHVDRGGAGLNQLVLKAAASVRRPVTPPAESQMAH
jgi:formate dehydrogenase subunit delta